MTRRKDTQEISQRETIGIAALEEMRIALREAEITLEDLLVDSDRIREAIYIEKYAQQE